MAAEGKNGPFKLTHTEAQEIATLATILDSHNDNEAVKVERATVQLSTGKRVSFIWRETEYNVEYEVSAA